MTKRAPGTVSTKLTELTFSVYFSQLSLKFNFHHQLVYDNITLSLFSQALFMTQ